MNSIFKFDVDREKRWFASRRPSGKMIFILLGIVSTLWFLIRVVPKPSRASYPCMQAAAPFAASFLSYMAGLTLSVVAIRKLRSSGSGRSFIGAAFA
ncbi:MAG: hypothetical protein KAH26_07090, partial [Bacteroidales bacterium]|nr:hypothetical protein [Bacteroidales bacterium]